MTAPDSIPSRMQPLVAARALRRLIKDPERTEEVFVIIRALGGPSLRRGHKRFAETAVGQRVFAEQQELLHTLLDRDALAAHPADSLAAAYLGFTGREQITADGLVEASTDQIEGAEDPNPEVALYSRRLRDQHDLWHTLTGYGRDELGEACLLGFTYAQTRNRGLGVIALVGGLKLTRFYGFGALRAIWRGFQDGRRAGWLPGQHWETRLAEPLDSVRDSLGIRAPVTYRAVQENLTPAAA